MNSPVFSRLQEVCRAILGRGPGEHIKNVEMADLIGVSAGRISQIKKGGGDLGGDAAARLAHHGVRYEYVADGTGKPFVSRSGPQKPATVALLDEDAELIANLACLLPEDADVWRAQIRAAAAKARRASGPPPDQAPKDQPSDLCRDRRAG